MRERHSWCPVNNDLMRSQTAVFCQIVGDHMAAAPVVVAGGTPSAIVVAEIVEKRATAALVTGPDARLCGILTERDVVRRLAFRAVSDTPIRDVMTAPVMTIAEDDYLYHAIARMRRFKLRHMPVVDATGSRMVMQIDHLTQEGTVDGMREIKSAQVDLARQLFDDNVPVPTIQSLLTHINRDIHRRVVEMNLRALKEEGKGDPPVPFAFIVMGSGGRGENFLYPDQDNGFILDDYPDADHARIDGWFIDLAERVTRDLDAVGFPYCNGYVMATNPVWRKSISQWKGQTISQWKGQIAGWLRRRNTVALRLSDIFFDFRSCYGAPDLAADLRAFVTDAVAGNASFLKDMYRDDEDYGVALGWFGRFITVKDDPDHDGTINMKHSGTLPLVQSIRLLALREGIPATSTCDRLRDLHGAGVLDAAEFDYLTNAFQEITFVLLRQQIDDFGAGRKVGNYVHPDTLNERERDELVDAFKAIKRLLDRVRGEVTGDVF
jgi:signal-transduction protein with cAMP-binding, CBS, and nucleotidyltransferase domain